MGKFNQEESIRSYIKKTLNEANFKTSDPRVDDETGSVEWDVTYGKVDIDDLYSEINLITKKLETLLKNNRKLSNDVDGGKLETLIKGARHLRNIYSRYKRTHSVDEMSSTGALVQGGGLQIATPLGTGPKKKKSPSGYTKTVKR